MAVNPTLNWNTPNSPWGTALGNDPGAAYNQPRHGTDNWGNPVQPTTNQAPSDPFTNNTNNIITGGLKFNSADPGKDVLNRLLQGLFPRAAAQIGFGNSLEPGREQSIQQILNMFSPQGLQGNVDEQRRSALAAAPGEAQRNAVLLDATGAGPGSQAGAAIDATNKANQSANDLSSYYASGQGRQAINSMLQSLFSQGQSVPGMQDIASVYGGIKPPPPNPDTSGGLFGALGSFLPLLGGLAGGGAGAAGGGALESVDAILNRLF